MTMMTFGAAMDGWPVRWLYRSYLADPGRLRASVEAFRGHLLPYLQAWERHGVHIGMVSWEAAHWIGALYGRWYASRTEFMRGALQEYAACFRTACVEIGPSGGHEVPALLHLESQVPAGFAFTAVVADETLMYRFPYGHPDRAKRGERNAAFLTPSAFDERVLPVLELLGRRVAAVVLRIARIYRTERYPFAAFLRQLDGLLGALPHTYRYAVDVDNPEYLLPAYFDCLRSHGAAHVIRSRQEQEGEKLLGEVEHPGVLTGRCAVMHCPAAWSEETVLALVGAVRRCCDEKRELYLYMQDGQDPRAPQFVMRMMEAMNPELARLSPIRRKAA